MAMKNKKIISSLWMFTFVATLYTLSHICVEGLQTLDKNNYGPKPKGTFKTIEVPEDGDLIDCVDFYKQPAFSDPRIKHLKPSPSLLSLFSKTNEVHPPLIQNWHKYGRCPNGTIPIRRNWNHNATNHRQISNDNPDEHEYAIGYQDDITFNGAGATLNVWNPQVRGRNELSLSQIWVSSGRRQPPINTIEAGWIVYPDYFHGPQPRVFIFWTNNNYRTACYNLECRGFVQTNFDITLGSPISPVSVFNGVSYDLHVNLVRDQTTKAWWLQVSNKQLGYFPPQIFTSLGDGADYKVAFGGEIVNKKTGNRHTTTQMGNGHFPPEGYRRASFVRNMRVVNQNNELVDPILDDIVTNPACYDLVFGPPGTIWNSHFYFGGPGLGPGCP